MRNTVSAKRALGWHLSVYTTLLCQKQHQKQHQLLLFVLLVVLQEYYSSYQHKLAQLAQHVKQQQTTLHALSHSHTTVYWLLVILPVVLHSCDMCPPCIRFRDSAWSAG